MAIEFQSSSALGGAPIWVLQNGRRLGGIYQGANGMFGFHLGDHEKLGGADLADRDLEQLRAKIRAQYSRA